MQNLVSIITPTWNSEKYILETIRSVQSQSYKHWEMIIVDDNSIDNTVQIIQKIAAKEPRIKLFKQKENMGAGIARNYALQNAKGRFIAYLDSDDLWEPEKLAKQINFMIKKNCGFSCTSYEVIDAHGQSLHKIIHMLERVDYIKFLTNNLLQTVGIMVDTEIVNKKLLIMPPIRRRQDAATWLQILKEGYDCFGMQEVLAKYRRTPGSLSSDKIKSIWGTWCLYRKIEKLTILFSIYCFIRYAFLAVWKRFYLIKG